MAGEQGEREQEKELQREGNAQAKATGYECSFGGHGNELDIVERFILKQLPAQKLVTL